MIKAILRHRVIDNWGSGAYGASRGDRTHNGIDYACPPGTSILAPCDGVVTKLGYPYGDDLSFRYVQITRANGEKWRIFYVEPSVELNQQVYEGDIVGKSQALGNRYDKITEHIHLEVKDMQGNYHNPEELI